MQSSLTKSGSSLNLSAQDESKEPLEGKIRRVFTTHARRRTRKKEMVPGFSLIHMMKEPLRVVHSVPLSFPNG